MPPLTYIHASEAARTTAGGGLLAIGGGLSGMSGSRKHSIILTLLLCLVATLPTVAQRLREGASAGMQLCPIVKMQVKRLPDMNMARGEHATFFLNGELTVVGGHTTSFVPTPTAEYLHDGQWHQVAMAYAHDHALAIQLSSGKVLIAGGQDQPLGIGQTFTAELYDPATHTSTGFGCLSTKRTMACGVELDSGRVLITGNWYHDDSIEMFDGRNWFAPVKMGSQGRAAPFVFRTARNNAIIVGNHDVHGRRHDSIVVDRLHGTSFRPPLLQEWRPMTHSGTLRNELAFIGDATSDVYAYLMPVVREGQIAIALVNDTVFTLLRTDHPVPMQTATGDTIIYPNCVVASDRTSRKAYLTGMDSDKRLYVYAIDYARLFAPDGSLRADSVLSPLHAQLYCTDPLPDCGFAPPVLDNDGNLMIAGGYHLAGIESDNFTPTASVWLIPVGRPVATTHNTLSLWLWLLPMLLAAVGIVILLRRRKSRQTLADSISVQPSCDNHFTANKPDGELFSRISNAMKEQQLFRNPELKASDVAAALGTNTRYVIDSIRTGCGQTFSQFVNSYRIDRAKQLLLQSPGKALVEIYTDAGFSSERSFFRAFKDATGMTTREWLNSQQT